MTDMTDRRQSLKRYLFTLTTVGPVHIGSGQSLNQRELIVRDNPSASVLIPDQLKLTKLLAEKGRLADFVDYAEGKKGSGNLSLAGWLAHCDLTRAEEDSLGYTIDVQDFSPAKSSQGPEPFNQLNLFVKDPFGRPYIPGSSLKGAIRSLILRSRLSQSLDGQALSLEQPIKRWETAKEAKEIEREQLQTLGLPEKPHGDRLQTLGQQKRPRGDNMRADILRGILVADSEPLSLSDLTVCQKIDANASPLDGGRTNCWGLPLFRECLKPGTQVSFTITVDTSLTDGQSLYRAIDNTADASLADSQNLSRATAKAYSPFPLSSIFDRPDGQPDSSSHLELLADLWYQTYMEYLNHFKLSDLGIEPEQLLDSEGAVSPLYLGAGSGFYSKTVWDVAEPDFQERQEKVQEILLDTPAFTRQGHHHENDTAYYGVSPRIIKLTKYAGAFYEMGKCGFTIERLD